MNNQRAPGIFSREYGIRSYLIVCLGGLLAIVAGLLERQVGLSVWFPLIVGVCAVLLRSKAATLWLILSLLWVLWLAGRGLDLLQSVDYLRILAPAYPGSFVWRPLSDGAICAGVLLYAAGNYRLQGLVLHLFPSEPRFQPSSLGTRRGAPPRSQACRSAGSVSASEIGRLLLLVAGCTAAAFLFWFWLNRQEARWERSPEYWHIMVLVWLLGVGLIVAASLFNYLGQRRISSQEASVYLQDLLWRETPREQRRLMYWLAWARLRRKQREVEP